MPPLSPTTARARIIAKIEQLQAESSPPGRPADPYRHGVVAGLQTALLLLDDDEGEAFLELAAGLPPESSESLLALIARLGEDARRDFNALVAAERRGKSEAALAVALGIRKRLAATPDSPAWLLAYAEGVLTVVRP